MEYFFLDIWLEIGNFDFKEELKSLVSRDPSTEGELEKVMLDLGIRMILSISS